MSIANVLPVLNIPINPKKLMLNVVSYFENYLIWHTYRVCLLSVKKGAKGGKRRSNWVNSILPKSGELNVPSQRTIIDVIPALDTNV